MRKSNIIVLTIILISFALGVYFYPRMPERIASHWNVQGGVDGYMPKFWGLFLMPIVCLLLLLLFVIIPKIDPLGENIEKFRKYFDGFFVAITVFLFYLYTLTIIWNLGSRFNFGQFLLPALGPLFYLTGNLIENTKRNWFVGIRTPWTLSSDQVWDKTHRIGGKLFKIAGVITFLGIFFERYAVFFVIVPVISIVIYTFIYSYFIYSYFEHQKQIT